MFIYYWIPKLHINISKIYYTSTYFNGVEQTTASALSCLKVYAPLGRLIEYIPQRLYIFKYKNWNESRKV